MVNNIIFNSHRREYQVKDSVILDPSRNFYLTRQIYFHYIAAIRVSINVYVGKEKLEPYDVVGRAVNDLPLSIPTEENTS